MQNLLKGRSLGLDAVFRGVYPEPVEGFQAYSASARQPVIVTLALATAVIK